MREGGIGELPPSAMSSSPLPESFPIGDCIADIMFTAVDSADFVESSEK